jgi:hypothetical protein
MRKIGVGREGKEGKEGIGGMGGGICMKEENRGRFLLPDRSLGEARAREGDAEGHLGDRDVPARGEHGEAEVGNIRGNGPDGQGVIKSKLPEVVPSKAVELVRLEERARVVKA